MRAEPVSNGTSALLHFFSRTKMIQYLCKKYITNLSLIFNISIVQCTQTNQSVVNYFEDQRYQSFKTKNVESKYEQNVSCTVKRDEKKHANIYSKYSRKIVHQKIKRSTKMLPWKGKRQYKNVIKETRKNNANHRQSSVMTLLIDKKEIVKKFMPKEKLQENWKVKN